MNLVSQCLTVLALAGLLTSTSIAQTPAPAPEAAATPAGGAFDMGTLTPDQQAAVQQAIIKASQNPVGNIAVIPFQSNANYALGPYARFQYNLNIQPVVPLMLSKNMTLVARTIVPLISNPSSLSPGLCPPSGDCGSTFGIGDIQEQLYFAPKTKPGAVIWGAGPILQFPSASPDTLGAGKWAAGPAAVGLVMPGPWVTGLLVTQLWSYAGKANRPAVDSGLFQPFINYNLKGGWSITTAPILTVNYTAPGNQKWSIPVGGGGSKTFKLGDQLMQVSVFYYTYIERPISTPQTNLRVVWSLLFPLKRGFDLQEILQQAGVKN